MVEKIDRPKQIEPWAIKPASSANDQDGGAQQQEAEQEDGFSSSDQLAPWTNATNETIPKIMRLERTQIRHIWFRRVLLYHNQVVLECDIEASGDRMLHAAQLMLPRIDDYLRFRGYANGQEIPIPDIINEPIVDVAIPARKPPRKTKIDNQAGDELGKTPSPFSLMNVVTGKIRPLVMLGYIAMVILFITLLLLWL